MKHKKILLVDDDPDDQFFFRDALNETASHLKCIVANNGVEALTLLEATDDTPSIIFLDLNMPMMNGFEFLQHMKANNNFKHIRVVIFTTSSNPADRKLSIELGAERFLSKTADFKLLKQTLSEILQDH
jgi:CheY-like chemotaxis protein